jgi:hypothetical protein
MTGTALCERCETFVEPSSISRWTDRDQHLGICQECDRAATGVRR